MKANHKTIASLAAAALLVALVVVVSIGAYRQIQSAADARTRTFGLIVKADNLLGDLVSAETGSRGFALTGTETFLQPYLAVHEGIRGHLQELRPLVFSSASYLHLDAMVPLVDAKLAEMARVVGLRRNQDMAAVVAAVRSGEGKRLMDLIRTEMGDFIGIEQAALAGHELLFQSHMRDLLATIIVASLLALLFALAFARLIYRNSHYRLDHLVHLETRHLLERQDEVNTQLRQANSTLQVSEQNLVVTLNSIGDAVIATDAEGNVTRLNPLGERLTGWTQAEAAGHSVDEVFRIINQETRKPSVVPVRKTLEYGTLHGLANHTILIARGGSECIIADSCAPIRDLNDKVIGAVLVFRDVSREYAVQQAVRDGAAQIQAILNTVADGIVTFHAQEGLVETVNPAAERMFGREAAELIGQNISLLIPEFERGDTSIGYYDPGDEARAAGRGREVTGRRKDGGTFPLEIAVSEMVLGGRRYFTAVLRDISARKRVDEALLKAGALENAILTSANFSIIATDEKGTIQLFNIGAELMLGYQAAEVINRLKPSDIHDPQEVKARARELSLELATTIAPGFEALAFKASRGIADIYELTYIRKDGSRFPAIVSITALRDERRGIIGYLLIGSDNSVRKRIESERNEAMAAAQKANLAKTDFLSSMSHELRTPLNAILGFAQLMESGSPPPSPPQKRNLDQILKAGWYLLELINEILDLALIESGNVTLSHEPVSLQEVLLECRAMIESQAQRRGIKMTFPRFEAPYFVTADRTRVKQVLINLLFNAIKYNKPEGTIVVECLPDSTRSIRISVRDSGAGLTPAQLAQLFQPFNRLGKESGGEEGTGIGLVVTKRLVELMGGVIGVDSVVGVGTVFWVELGLTGAPRFAAQDAGHVRPVRSQAEDGAPPRTLLYVEDNPANLELVEQLIARRPDLNLLSAADGDIGIEFARVYQPEVILMDINLPGISGIEAMTILRNDPSTAHIPIIALSANAVPRDIEAALAAGFSNYLTKPIKVAQFMDALDAALKLSKTVKPAIAGDAAKTEKEAS